MSGPARAGGLLYAKDIERVSRYYEAVLKMLRLHCDREHIVLDSDDFQLIVHAMPKHIAVGIEISIPPEVRERTPLKLFFTVESIVAARKKASELGGEIFVDSWQGPGFIVCNGYDPEGNVFQVREIIS